MKRAIALIAFSLLVAGCGIDTEGSPVLNPSKPIQDARDITDGLDVSSPCRAAFQAAAARPVGDTARLDDAVSSCLSLAEWRSAAGDFPDVMSGSDPDQFLGGRCIAVPALASTPLCLAVNP